MDNQELKKILNNNAPADFDLEGVFGLMLACGNLIEQNARLREALEFYADDMNWIHEPATSHPDCMDFVSFIQERDAGTIAREALKGGK